jgi:hypothetical protein
VTTHLRGGTVVEDPRLGRVRPRNWEHVDKFPLLAANIEAMADPQPVAAGINWYRAFYAGQLIERRTRGGHKEYWVRDDVDLGPLEGGHAITLEPFHGPNRDTSTQSWYQWYNQIEEGICVGEMCARVMSLLNNRKYQPRPIYDIAQSIDEWEGEQYDGTSVNAGLRVLRDYGSVKAKRGEQHFVHRGEVTHPFSQDDGIIENRWALDDTDVCRTLGNADTEFVVWLNSWGAKSYPWRVKVPRNVLIRLMREDAEMGIVTDRPNVKR